MKKLSITLKRSFSLIWMFSMICSKIYGQGADCATALAHPITITKSISYSATGETNHLKGNDYDISNISNYCGDPSYMDGEDYLYAFTPADSGYVTIRDSSYTNPYNAIFVFDGCPLTGTCQGSNTSYGYSKSLQVHVSANETYYVMIDYWPNHGANTYFSYNISISNIDTVQVGFIAPNNQDCLAAIPVCKNIYTQSNSYKGSGNLENEIDNSISCLSAEEYNDVWYSFTVQKSGNLSFLITPNNLADDYDWAVFNLTNATCAAIDTVASLQVSCNWSGTTGTTGPNGGSILHSQSSGGSPYNAVIAVNEGEIYAINVSNYSATQSGYTIDFSASTAVIYDNKPPSLSSAIVPSSCPMSSLTVNFSENILTNTITTTDFTLTSSTGTTYTISSLGGPTISSGAPYGRSFTLGFSPAITTPGDYTLNLVGPVADLCGNVSIVPQSIPVKLTYSSFSALGITANLGAYCNVKTYSLCAPSGFSSYTWTFNGGIIAGATTHCITVTEPGNYCVSVNSSGSCYEIAIPLIIN